VSQRVASIDVGTNAIRFFAVEMDGDSISRVLAEERIPVRFGHGVFSEGRISPQEKEAALKGLERTAARMKELSIQKLRAVATSAVRESPNRREFVRAVKQRAGISLEVISGSEEIRLVHLAVAKRILLGADQWIMVELGEHCHTHIIPRLNKVIEGTDDGGITQVVGWKGGGGFRYHRLAPSLLAKDEHGNWVVNKQYNPAMLAEAVCKLEGYRYAPSSEIYWQHGHSSEDSFIYVTTQTLLVEQLRRLNDEVGPRRGLLICCGAFTARNLSDFPRLTVKKIPKAVLHRCEWGHDDYSLEIRNLPPAAAPPTPQTPLNGSTGKDSRRRMVTLLSYGET